MVTLNHAVAVAMVHGPRAGLDLLGTLDADDRLAGHHRLDAVRAHLLEMAGDHAAARAAYRTAARRTTSLPEQRYLEERAARLTSSPRSRANTSRLLAGIVIRADCGRPCIGGPSAVIAARVALRPTGSRSGRRGRC